jgi:hypothetical protein
MGIFLVALKEDGTLWWTKAPQINDDYSTANACTWTRLTNCENYGWDANDNETQPNKLTVTSNPDYRFITSIPFELFKYAKKPDIYGPPSPWGTVNFYQDSASVTTLKITIGSFPNDMQAGDEVYITISGRSAQSGFKTILDSTDDTITYQSTGGILGTPASPITATGNVQASGKRANNIDSDSLNTLDVEGNVVIDESTKGSVTGVLISSRRVYKDGAFNFVSPITADTHQSLIAYVDPTGNSGAVAVKVHLLIPALLNSVEVKRFVEGCVVHHYVVIPK